MRPSEPSGGGEMQIKRFESNPIIRPDMDGRMGSNINGPSPIRVPDWVPHRLGTYYLYFAHHQGTYIRMAYADELKGPWSIYTPGVLDLADAFFDRHIASPDVHVIEDRREIWMYYHGCCLPDPPHQFERVAISRDGLSFQAQPEILGRSYWRVFRWRERAYALAMPGVFYRSWDGLTHWEQWPTLFSPEMRHSAVRLEGDRLQVYYSNAGDEPERILLSTIPLEEDWRNWRASEPVVVLEPEMDYEGAHLPLAPSQRGAALEPVCQLRDPCISREGDRTYLAYSVAGESGIALAEIIDD